MEREMEMQTQTFKDENPRRGNPGGNGDGPEREMLLADVIYVFFDKNESGSSKKSFASDYTYLFKTEEFMERLNKLEKVCHHFHLSLQSGCDETLKRMNRKYTIEEFEKGVNLLRNKFPNVALTTDIIVGFPGETNEEFENTISFVNDIKFAGLCNIILKRCYIYHMFSIVAFLS